jgi:hypothetical protein
MSDMESLMSKMTKLKAVSRLMLQTRGESRSTHTQYAGGHIIVPTSVGAVIWIFREPPAPVLSTYQPRLSENFEGLMGMWIYQYPHWSKTRVKELTLDCQFFATTFMRTSNSLKLFKSSESEVLLLLRLLKTWEPEVLWFLNFNRPKTEGIFNKIKELPNTDYLLTRTQIDEILDSIKLGLVKFTIYYLHPKLHPNYG